MKTLSVQQPWASIICSGLKDVENRTWETHYRGKLLIHASAKKVVPRTAFDNTWHEEYCDITNGINHGNLPPLEEMPTGAIIGFVDLTDCIHGKTDSIYDGGADLIKWKMENAYLFDEPITGVKGRLGLWEYPLDENNLPPYHAEKIRKPEVRGTTLWIPVADRIFDVLIAEKQKQLFLMPFSESDASHKSLFKSDESFDFVDIKEVTFEAKDGRSTTYQKPGLRVYDEEDENGNTIVDESPTLGEINLQTIEISFE